MGPFSDQIFFHRMDETSSEEKVRGWEGTSNDNQNMEPVKYKYLRFRNVKAYGLMG